MAEQESKTVGTPETDKAAKEAKAEKPVALSKAEERLLKAKAALAKAKAEVQKAFQAEFKDLPLDKQLKRWREGWLIPFMSANPFATQFKDGTPLDGDVIPPAYKGEPYGDIESLVE